jgi:hypothetical protein
MRRLNTCRHRIPHSGGLRHAKVRRIRSAIRAGKYDNELRLRVAIDRLMNSVLRARKVCAGAHRK